MQELLLIDAPADIPASIYVPSSRDALLCDVPAEFIALTLLEAD